MKTEALQALQHVRTTLAYQLTPEAVSELLEPIQRVLEADEQGGKTGWPAGLLQDDCRELSKWLASRLDSSRMVREVCADIEETSTHNDKVEEAYYEATHAASRYAIKAEDRHEVLGKALRLIRSLRL